jgi:conjugal transfer pilus assembly protein TraW
MRQFQGLLFLLLGLFPFLAHPESLGVMGNVYDIQEEDAVSYIKRKLGEMEKAGEINTLQEKAKKTVEHSMRFPEPVKGITTVTENRVSYFNPTFVQPQNAVDIKGRIIVAAGTTVNPLQYGGLSKHYLFIDARDKKQIEFAKNNHDKRPMDKIVLTGGSWVDLSKNIGTQVFYDQSGFLTRKLGVHRVPTVVSQDGLRLKIEEIVL